MSSGQETMYAINRGAIATGNRLLDSLRDAPPHFFRLGAKICITPEKENRGNRLPGYYWQHRSQHSTASDKMQGALFYILIHPQPAALGRLTGLWFCVKISIHRSSILSTKQEGLLRQLEGVPYGRADA